MTGFHGWARKYFAAKSRHDLDALAGSFDPDIAYEDAVLRRRTVGADRLRATYAAIFAGVPDSARSNLTWSAGGAGGGAVQFLNDAALFGAPMRVVAVIELDRGRVTRQRDYWDGRALPGPVLAGLRATYPAHMPPARLAAGQRSPRAPVLDAAARAYRDAMESGSSIAGLLADDVVLEDLALGVRVVTRDAVAAHLARWSAALPYGRGARETNVVGGAGGGAWEWAASPAFAEPVGAGVTAMRLAPGGRIAELVFGWDTSRLSSRRYRELPGTGDRA
ncbi:MAG: nuclear transport factor 2 family protein [Streptosporangiaceae bacterium]